MDNFIVPTPTVEIFMQVLEKMFSSMHKRNKQPSKAEQRKVYEFYGSNTCIAVTNGIISSGNITGTLARGRKIIEATRYLNYDKLPRYKEYKNG